MALDCDGGTITLSEIVDEINTLSDEVDGASNLGYDDTKIYPKDAFVIIRYTLPSGLEITQEYISLIDNNQGNDPATTPGAWKINNATKWSDVDITVTVGVGGDFANINDAVEFFARYNMAAGAQFYIQFVHSHTVNYFVTIPKLNITNGITFISDGTTTTFDVSTCNDVDDERSLFRISSEAGVKFENMTIDINGTYSVTSQYYSPLYMRDTVFSGCTINYNATGSGSATQTAMNASFSNNSIFNYNSSSRWSIILYSSSIVDTQINGDMQSSARLVALQSGYGVRNISGNYRNYQYGVSCWHTENNVFVRESDLSGASAYGVRVSSGGICSVYSCKTSFSQTPGSVTNNGIIFDIGGNTAP